MIIRDVSRDSYLGLRSWYKIKPRSMLCYLLFGGCKNGCSGTFENTFLSLRISSPFQLLFILGCLGSNVPQLRRCLDGQTYRVRLLDFIFLN